MSEVTEYLPKMEWNGSNTNRLSSNATDYPCELDIYRPHYTHDRLRLYIYYREFAAANREPSVVVVPIEVEYVLYVCDCVCAFRSLLIHKIGADLTVGGFIWILPARWNKETARVERGTGASSIESCAMLLMANTIYQIIGVYSIAVYIYIYRTQ